VLSPELVGPAPWPRELGLVDSIVGLPLTVKADASDPLPASVLVTVRVRAPVLAPEAIVTFSFSWVALSKVVELIVMPVPESDTVELLAKFVPLTTTFSVPP